jgi:hypothetical protein
VDAAGADRRAGVENRGFGDGAQLCALTLGPLPKAAAKLRPVAKVFDGIDERLQRWIAAQPMYFVGTAPLDADGHVNVSPKAPSDTLKVLDSHTVAYLDFVGSGAETIAHLRENGRIVIMLCAFQGPPRIVRLHGQAQAFTADTPGYEALREQVADSCGYGVPLMTIVGTRPHFDAWAGKKVRVGGPEALRNYQRELNSQSIDGLPAVKLPDEAAPRT